MSFLLFNFAAAVVFRSFALVRRTVRQQVSEEREIMDTLTVRIATTRL